MTPGALVKRRASVKTNAELISIRPYSGHRLFYPEPGGSEQLLRPDASDDELGAALLQALEESRTVSVVESLRMRESVQKDYESWVESLLRRFGYKSRRAMFKSMKSCEVDSDGERIVMLPTRHDRLEGWGRAEGDGIEDVSISASSSRDDVGVALRLALSRCS